MSKLSQLLSRHSQRVPQVILSYPQQMPPRVKQQEAERVEEPPSSEYLEVTTIPSERLDSRAPRKLLVLDLNGTLLFRPKRHTHTTTGYRPRPVRLRPYIPSFRKFLSHEKTKEWLDAMVWSSAQPVNVTDMVQHCFPNEKDDFLAVWARDTLGLTAVQYGTLYFIDFARSEIYEVNY